MAALQQNLLDQYRISSNRSPRLLLEQ